LRNVPISFFKLREILAGLFTSSFWLLKELQSHPITKLARASSKYTPIRGESKEHAFLGQSPFWYVPPNLDDCPIDKYLRMLAPIWRFYIHLGKPRRGHRRGAQRKFLYGF